MPFHHPQGSLKRIAAISSCQMLIGVFTHSRIPLDCKFPDIFQKSPAKSIHQPFRSLSFLLHIFFFLASKLVSELYMIAVGGYFRLLFLRHWLNPTFQGFAGLTRSPFYWSSSSSSSTCSAFLLSMLKMRILKFFCNTIWSLFLGFTFVLQCIERATLLFGYLAKGEPIEYKVSLSIRRLFVNTNASRRILNSRFQV